MLDNIAILTFPLLREGETRALYFEKLQNRKCNISLDREHVHLPKTPKRGSPETRFWRTKVDVRKGSNMELLNFAVFCIIICCFVFCFLFCLTCLRKSHLNISKPCMWSPDVLKKQASCPPRRESRSEGNLCLLGVCPARPCGRGRRGLCLSSPNIGRYCQSSSNGMFST